MNEIIQVFLISNIILAEKRPKLCHLLLDMSYILAVAVY